MSDGKTKSRMNLPNRLTMTRLFCVPLYLAVILIDAIPYNILVAGIIFAFAMITDLLDGRIARKRNMVTNFGKFWDPLADKLMVLTALVSLVLLSENKKFAAIVCVTVLFRELIVTGLRMIASSEGGKVVAANIWGKMKTVFQTIYISFELLILFLAQLGLNQSGSAAYQNIIKPGLTIVSLCTGVIMLALTVWSAVTYFRECREYISG